jgi:putative ubiquitin-RnfH superfamily antitoxin RatB of RatAB toxin-antitoxin module
MDTQSLMVNRKFSIQVVYCQPLEQICVSLLVSEGCTAAQAISQSRLTDQFALQFEGENGARIGNFGKQISLDTVLKPGDRVEIYRPLLLSPTEARRLRAKTLAKS